MIKYLSILFVFVSFTVKSQELNANVVINHQQVRSSDDYIYDNMKKSFTEFLNNRKWTGDKYKLEERIECSFFITISSRSGNVFSGSIQVQSGRPVFGVNYKTTMFIVNDNDFDFLYVDQQALDFNQNEFTSNLTSIFAFYTYAILGLEYDSMSKEGGSKYISKAFDIMTIAQNGGRSGWRSSDGSQNRYWLIENLNNPAFKDFRDCMYKYHREGLDLMHKNKKQGEYAIFKALLSLESVHKRQPSSYLLQVFFNGKADEVVNVFQKATPQQKSKLVPVLIKIDPGNTKKYNKIIKGA
ncbi:MAG: hypothetical protein ACI9U0_001048 [Flavobacteriales bacterium]|jgi:hypothetical protein|tara:strand:+ start:9212 stop:10105 length:894 start_codon:yes stop_codon:yes gene_type:complete